MTSHSNLRSNHLSSRSKHQAASSHHVRREDSTDTDSRASDNLGTTTDEEGQLIRSIHGTISGILFFGAKLGGIDSLVT